MSAPEDNRSSQNDDAENVVNSNSETAKPSTDEDEKTNQSEKNLFQESEEYAEVCEINGTEPEAAVAGSMGEKEATLSNDEVPEKNFWKKNERTEIMKKASDLHCPFVWQADLHIQTYGDHDIDLLADADIMFEETGFKFRRFIVNLVLCYHSFYKRLIHDSLKYLEELEAMLAFSSKKENRDFLFHRINDALFHTTHSCRIYILEITNQKDQAKIILNKIKSFDSMDDQNKAGIWAIRANVYVEYGCEGVEAAIIYINQAISLDPANPYWHFMKGMYLGRLRRMTSGFAIPSEEEFMALKKAMEMREDPAFLAFTGEVYQETAKRSKHLYEAKFLGSDKESLNQLSSQLDVFNKTAASLFKKSVNLKPTCAHLLFRCGKGLMNLPKPHQDLKSAYLFLEKGLTISAKSSYGNHAMAMYLEKHEKDMERAKKFLNVSVNRKNFQAHFDVVRIKFLESLDVDDLIIDLEEMLNIYAEKPRRRKILAEIVAYYLFLNYDLGEACVHMRKLILMNSKTCDIINNYKSLVIPVHCSIPLLDVILSAMKCKGKNQTLRPEESNLYRKFIESLCEENIVVRSVPENLWKKFEIIVRNSFEKRKSEVEDSLVDKEVHQVHDEFHPDRNTANDEYFKYYRHQSPEKNETVDEFFAMFQKNNLVENNTEGDRENRRKHEHDKYHRSKKSHRKSKYDKDESDNRKRSHKSKKHSKKRSRKYSTSTDSESSSTDISDEDQKISLGRKNSRKTSNSKSCSKSCSPESSCSRGYEKFESEVRKTKCNELEVDRAKLTPNMADRKVSSGSPGKQLSVENDDKEIKKLGSGDTGADLLKDVENLKIDSGENVEKRVDDQIHKSLEKNRKKIPDYRISDESEDEKKHRKKHSKRKHEKSYRRHGDHSHRRDRSSCGGSDRSAPKNKSKREKRSSSGTSKSDHSFSSRKDEQSSNRKSERHGRRKDLENSACDNHSTSSK